jgi:BMFP domain-containing protein YqiC
MLVVAITWAIRARRRVTELDNRRRALEAREPR